MALICRADSMLFVTRRLCVLIISQRAASASSRHTSGTFGNKVVCTDKSSLKRAVQEFFGRER